jgi:predicted secreted protein
MKPARSLALAVFVLVVLTVALIVAACDTLGEEATTTEAASTTTTWPVNTVFIDETADGTSVHLDLGDILVLRLQGNPSTGYSWQFTDEGDPILQKQGAFTFTPDSDALGSGGVYQSVSLAVAEGTTFLALNYVGPDGQVDHNYYVDVVVGNADAGSTTTESTIVVASTESTEPETTPSSEEDTTPSSEEETTTSSEPEPEMTYWTFDRSDGGLVQAVRVGDSVHIELDILATEEVTAVRFDNVTPEVLDTQPGQRIRDESGTYVVKAIANYRVTAAGEGGIVVYFTHPDGHSPVSWWFSVMATE